MNEQELKYVVLTGTIKSLKEEIIKRFEVLSNEIQNTKLNKIDSIRFILDKSDEVNTLTKTLFDTCKELSDLCSQKTDVNKNKQ